MSEATGALQSPFLKLIPKDKKHVLVIGCGEGQEVAWLNRHGFEAVGITNNPSEAKNGGKKFSVDLRVADMHDLNLKTKFDAVFANQVLEHSVAPFLALLHWRDFLNNKGYLVVGMPSREWIPEFYHYSVLTHSQMKDLLSKAGYKLLAGPEKKPEIGYNGGDIFKDLGRGWGHNDAYVAEKTNIPNKGFMLGESNLPHLKISPAKKLIRAVLKYPYNKLRVYHARTHHE